MSSGELGRSPDALAGEITGRFGMLPNFFRAASAAPGLLEDVWTFAKSTYVDSPLPTLLKERLFVHLSRFCEVRYCIVRHVAFLLGQGRPSGDPDAKPQTVEQVLALLARPVPDAAGLKRVFARLEAREAPPGAPEPGLPEPGSAGEDDLFDALTVVFLVPHHSARARAAVRVAVGDRQLELLVALLAFVRTSHYWSETHPELAFEPDAVALLERNPDLARALLDGVGIDDTRGNRSLSALTDLRRLEGALRESETNLRQRETWLAAQTEAFQAAMNGAPLEAALAILVRAVVGMARDGRRCAFYIVDEEAGGLRHVVGMPEGYAAVVDQFEVSPESLAGGLAVATGKPVVTPDVLQEPRWQPWVWLAREHGFRGCWSFPVETAAGKPVGSFAAYFREPRHAQPRDFELATAVTQTAAIIISRHQENAQRVRSEERLRQFGEASSDVLWIRDAVTLQWIYLTPAFETIYGLDRETALSGDNMTGWLNLILVEDRQHALDCIERVRAGERVSFEYRIRRPGDGKVRWLRNTDFPMRDPSGALRWVGGVGRDITSDKEAAERMQVMVGELQHRTRNLMGVVRALSDKTMARSVDLADFRARYSDRLATLARVQALLSRLAEGERITFDALIRDELAAHGEETAQIRLDGPRGVALRSSTVQTFALVLHELATNAVKYGALGQPRARLDVRWRVEREGPDARPWLHVDWRERGVSMPGANAPPRGGGSGRELIERALPYQLGARTTFALEADGVHCTIALPISERQTARDAVEV